MTEQPSAAEWAERLQSFLGAEARLSDAGMEPNVWTGLDAVTVEVRETWRVEDIHAEGECLALVGKDDTGGEHGVRVPVPDAFLGVDAAGEFFLAGWRMDDGQHRYLRLSRDAGQHA